MSYLALIEENPQFICFATGHMWRFVLPLQKRDDKKREILSYCQICGTQKWRQLGQTEYKTFLKTLKE